MELSQWWFTPLMTFAGAVIGAAASILATWLTQRYSMKAQLALKRVEFETSVTAALRTEKQKRYLAILQSIESLYSTNQDLARKAEFLRAVREVWLLGDQSLVSKLTAFLVDIAGRHGADVREQLFGDVVLEMRRDIGLQNDGLTNEHFRFHSV